MRESAHSAGRGVDREAVDVKAPIRSDHARQPGGLLLPALCCDGEFVGVDFSGFFLFWRHDYRENVAALRSFRDGSSAFRA